MKKYIIGLFSVICLMGAGCTEFEDFTPVDMGEGPAVTVTAEKTAVDAFKVTITPARPYRPTSPLFCRFRSVFRLRERRRSKRAGAGLRCLCFR